MGGWLHLMVQHQTPALYHPVRHAGRPTLREGKGHPGKPEARLPKRPEKQPRTLDRKPPEMGPRRCRPAQFSQWGPVAPGSPT